MTKLPTSVLLDPRTIVDLRKRAARETIRTGRTVSPSSMMREFIEVGLYGTNKQNEENAAAEATA